MDVLQRVKDVSKMKFGGRKMMAPALKKKDVEYVIGQLQALL